LNLGSHFGKNPFAALQRIVPESIQGNTTCSDKVAGYRTRTVPNLNNRKTEAFHDRSFNPSIFTDDS